MKGHAVLVPVKAFSRAKLRLAPALSPTDRAGLARMLAARVVRSAAGLPVSVVCDDEEVAEWAASLGAGILWEPGRGLNGAVQAGFERLAASGADAVIVAAGDLPLATDIRWVSHFRGVTVVADRRQDGTNALGIPADVPFRFSYGPGSFARHVAECARLGLPHRVVRSSPLAWDVDVPEDLVGVHDGARVPVFPGD